MFEHGTLFHGHECVVAAEMGHLQCLQYAHEHGGPMPELTCAFAAFNGHLQCLQYAYEHGAPFPQFTCAIAACSGQLQCLKYAHEHGAPLPSINTHVTGLLLRYCVINGAPRYTSLDAMMLKVKFVQVAMMLKKRRRDRLVYNMLITIANTPFVQNKGQVYVLQRLMARTFDAICF
jgi:hypothetical protein